MQVERIREQRRRPPSDALVLAAADRARRHRDGSERGATLAAIADHIGMTWGPHASRRLRPIVDRLASELGWLQHSRWQSRDYWALTSTGSERLSRAMVEGIAEELPESPQHREWRRLREHAAARIETLRAELGELLAEANAMIDMGSGSGRLTNQARLTARCRRRCPDRSAHLGLVWPRRRSLPAMPRDVHVDDRGRPRHR
jgi:hypothetical protein